MHALDTVIGPKSDPPSIDSLLALLAPLMLSGTAYVGYPLVTLPSGTTAVDVLLTCREHGVVVFDLCRGAARFSKDDLVSRQRELRQAVEVALERSGRLSVAGKLIVEPRVLTLDPEKGPSFSIPDSRADRPAELDVGNRPVGGSRYSARRTPTLEEKSQWGHRPTATGSGPGTTGKDSGIAAGWDDVIQVLRAVPPIDGATLRFVDAAVHRLGAVRPTTSGSRIGALAGPRAGTLAKIEDQLANLDEWQKAAAIEMPDGPQRIRGLAGSGKTVVLAFKAAYLHAMKPHWRIVLTFYTRTLYEPLRELIRKFYREHTGGERDPNWDQLLLRHAWGATDRAGVYREVATYMDLKPLGMKEAKQVHGSNRIFESVCRAVLTKMGASDPAPLYDAVLIDEAQDVPATFMEMVYRVSAHPKRIVWAYDDLQNVMDYEPTSPAVLFGKRADGQPRVPELVHEEGEARSDIILPICYRNTPWALTAAHALGLGVYRHPVGQRESTGLVQFYDDARLWNDIGYVIEAGRVAPSEPVRLKRDPDKTPSFFRDLLDVNDAVLWRTFPNTDAEHEWVAAEILQNLTDDGLSARDVLIVSANPYFGDPHSVPLVRALTQAGVPAHIAGKSGKRDELFGNEGSVPISHINHAKGNEAAMVYVVHAEHGAESGIIVRRRNTLFAAITRSRAWVRISGSGSKMRIVEDELEQVVANNYTLSLTVPTAQELARMRKLQRDITSPRRRTRRQRIPGSSPE